MSTFTRSTTVQHLDEHTALVTTTVSRTRLADAHRPERTVRVATCTVTVHRIPGFTGSGSTAWLVDPLHGYAGLEGRTPEPAMVTPQFAQPTPEGYEEALARHIINRFAL